MQNSCHCWLWSRGDARQLSDPVFVTFGRIPVNRCTQRNWEKIFTIDPDFTPNPRPNQSELHHTVLFRQKTIG
jgi:hypothetical protein